MGNSKSNNRSSTIVVGDKIIHDLIKADWLIEELLLETKYARVAVS